MIDPDLQEQSALPCNTGSDRNILEKSFPGLNFESLGRDWEVKEGLYSTDDKLVDERAKRFNRRLGSLVEQLKDVERKDIIGCDAWGLHEMPDK